VSAFARLIGRNPRFSLVSMIALTLLATAGIGRVRFDGSLRSMTVRDDPVRVFHEQVEAIDVPVFRELPAAGRERRVAAAQQGPQQQQQQQ